MDNISSEKYNEASAKEQNAKRRKIKSSMKPVEGEWDAIVIGSGLSGLALSSLLGMHGYKVLVLERHFQVGGFTHVFRRREYEWDVGIHYLPGIKNKFYTQLAALHEGRIEFAPWEGIIDKIRFPGLSIDMPGKYEEYIEVLASHFPEEREGIAGYLAMVKKAREEYLQPNFIANSLPKPMTKAARALFIRNSYKAATTTTDEVMSQYIKDERLKDILDVQWGNIGMPRQRCSFMVHAAMLGSFLDNGAVYPKGGSSIFARELSETVHKQGGAIRIKAEVDSIITKNGRAVGVRMADGEEIMAKKFVVSTAGFLNTYNKFLRDEDNPKVEAVRAELNFLPMAYEYMNLFFGLDKDPADFGIDKANYWIAKDFGATPESMFWNLEDPSAEGQPQTIFLNSSCMRDPEHGEHGNTGYNGQVVLYGQQGFFDKWKETAWNKRGDEYEAVKQALSDNLFNAIERHFPGIKEHVTLTEFATPLSYITFSGHPRGVPYGLAPIPAKYRSYIFNPMTPVKGLYTAGQDLTLPGVAAAFGSVNMTASLLLKKNVGSFLYELGKKYV